MKRHLPWFHKIEFILNDIFDNFHLQFHKIEYILKVSFKKTHSIICIHISTIPQNWIYTKDDSWKDTLHNFYINHTLKKKNEFTRDIFHNSTILQFLYQSHIKKKIDFILKKCISKIYIPPKNPTNTNCYKFRNIFQYIVFIFFFPK